MEGNHLRSRRRFLSTAAVGVVGTLAGCNESDETESATGTASTTATRTPTATQTATPRDDRAPTIKAYGAEPRQNGTALAVSMEGTDDRGLHTARITYGDRELTREPDGKQVTIDGTLQDTTATTPDSGRVAYLLTDTAGNETRKYAQPDDNAPELTVEPRSIENAGKVGILLTAHDDTGLAEINTFLNGKTQQTYDAHGTRRFRNNEDLTVPSEQRGQRVPLGATAQDWNGNATENEVQTYVRKYDLMEDMRLSIGVHYILQSGAMFENGCVVDDREPQSNYADPIPTETTSRHIDQMTGHGINRIVYSYEGFSGSPQRLSTFVQSQLIDHVEVVPEISWNTFSTSNPETWKDEVVPEVTDLLRDTLMGNTTVATYDGRPVIRMGVASRFALGDIPRKHVIDQWGSYDAFMNDIRSRLSVDGADPFIYGGMSFVNWENAYSHPELKNFAPLLDGVSTWFLGINGHAGETYHWEDVLKTAERTFKIHRDFVSSNDMEFIPTAFPGFDDRGNECWGPDGKRHIPRSQERFREMLALAEEYATTDMIDTATWNDWAEGTMIEPGTSRDDRYGTDYLEVVEKFQRSEPE